MNRKTKRIVAAAVAVFVLGCESENDIVTPIDPNTPLELTSRPGIFQLTRNLTDVLERSRKM